MNLDDNIYTYDPLKDPNNSITVGSGNIDAVAYAEDEYNTEQNVKDDLINHPSHYNHGRIETIDYIEDCLGEDGIINYCLGNVIKYISRANFKGKKEEDIKKAQWYLNKAVALMEAQNE